jgi:hypothetical protein
LSLATQDTLPFGCLLGAFGGIVRGTADGRLFQFQSRTDLDRRLPPGAEPGQGQQRKWADGPRFRPLWGDSSGLLFPIATSGELFCKKQFALGMFSDILETLWHSIYRVSYGHNSRKHTDSR